MANLQIRIIGLGNPLMGDDGLGIAAIEQLQQEQLPAEIELLDGGCGGLSLLPLLEECQQAIIVDAADFAAVPGSIKILTHADLNQIPPQTSRPTSHQPGLAEILYVSKKLGQLPRLTLVFMQVENYDQGYGLTAQVTAALPTLIKAIRSIFSQPNKDH